MGQDNFSYHHLTRIDGSKYKSLLRMFGEAFGDTPAYQGAVPDDAYIQALLEKPSFIMIAALQGKEVVGGLAAYVLDKFEQDRREIYIYDLAVAEPHRRKGVATGLIRELQRIGQTLRAYAIFVQADPGDTPAIRLYESLGKREDVHHFDIPVKIQTK